MLKQITSIGIVLGILLVATPFSNAQDNDLPQGLLFDDFNYTSPEDEVLAENGWKIRAGHGWPGVEGAQWRTENVSFTVDPDDEENQIMIFTSSAEGDTVFQTQICHARKYYEGTYASRVYFTNEPVNGRDGDQVVQTFYLISTPELEEQPDYSEMDYEYLPNGGWGFRDSVFFGTSWETYRLDPWYADNTSGILKEDLAGWHVLIIQVSDGEINYLIDGELFATHDEYYYPEVPLSINFNLWFINGGLIASNNLREYSEYIDWVFHAQDVILDPDEVLAQVEAMRAEDIQFMDTVPAWEPELESLCNF